MKILLIAGHGAGDPGAVGNGQKEAVETRKITEILSLKLSQYASVCVYDTTRNAFKDVKNGVFKIGSFDYALEIHFNASNGKGRGTEIFVTKSETGTSVEKKIMNKLSSFFKNRGVKVGNFAVINTIKKKGISSALLEVCFIDNAEDMKVYNSNIDKIAEAITEGIVKGFGLKKQSSKKTIDQIAKEVISGQWGNGTDRKNRLQAAGYDYNVVQNKVNQLLS